MKLHRIAARNFMSLHSFEMNDLDPHINYIVGPNAAGKTTVLRALRVLRDTFAAVGQTNPYNGASAARERLLIDLRRRVTQSSNHESPPDEVDISVEVTLDARREADLLAAFLAAALCNRELLQRIPAQEQVNKNLSDPGVAVLSSWLLDAIRGSDLTWLLHGTLRMRCWLSTYDPRLLAGYTVQCGDTPITFGAGWRPAYSQGHLIMGHLEPDDPPLHETGEPFTRHLKEDPARWSQVLNALTSLEPATITSSLDVQALMRALASDGENLGVQGAYQYPFPPSHQRLSELLGVPLRDSNANRVSVAAVFAQILREALVFTENIRAPLASAQTYSWQQVANATPEIWDERELPAQLFWLKSGDSSARARYKRIQETFGKLVGGAPRSFEVVADRRHMQARQALSNPTTMQLDGNFSIPVETDPVPEVALDIMYIGRHGRELPLADQGAGMWELLVLSSLIHDSTGRVILLDEPATNLHANAQRTLRDLLRTTQGQFLVVTHSQHLLPTLAKDLPKIRRLQHVDSSTVVFDIGPQSKIPPDKLEKEMSDGSDLAGLLFASGVILVEGATETAAIGVWYPLMQVSGGRTLADDNIALFCVNGKPNFPLHMQYLVEFGIPWVVICDVDALNPASPNTVWKQLQDLGGISQQPTTEDFAALNRLAEAHGVFTANTALSETNGFEDIPQVKHFLDANPWARERSKARQGRVIAQNLACPQGVEETIQAALAWLRTSSIEEVSRRVQTQEPTV